MLNLGLKVVNPLIDEIKEHYTELFNVINNVSKLVFSRYNLKLPEEEVGYIALHIDVSIQRKQRALKKLNVLIVCPSGIGSARILSNKVKFMFPDIGNVAIEALHDIDKSLFNNEYDLILSTVPIKLNIYEHKMIVVSPFITKSDIENINEFIMNLKVNNNGLNINESWNKDVETVSQLEYDTANEIIKNLLLKNAKADKVEDLVGFIVEDIKDLGLIEETNTLKRAIIKREEDGNVVVQGANVALLHTRIDNLEIPFVGVYRLKKPITTSGIGFSKEDVNTFIVMVARKKESNYILKILGKISVALNENERFIEDLKTGSLVGIRKHLVNIVNDEVE
jgi:mannitol operon transcriptional antiterminator